MTRSIRAIDTETDGTNVRAPRTIWRRGGILSVTCVLSLWTATAHGACTSPSATAATRAMADAQCPCATATSHRGYVKCVAGVAKSAVASGRLPKQCRHDVLRCATQSTCGRSGFVSCCRTSAKGVTKCSIKADTKCTAPKTGAACMQDVPSCCDACGVGSCPLSTTTTIPGGLTTTTMIGPQTHTVMVGQNGLTFTPARLTIHAGDTVHWVWASGGHSVVSGTDGTTDNQFCSPDDTGCANPPLSNAGATFDHTFAGTGSFPYYCSVHFSLGMTGTITVR